MGYYTLMRGDYIQSGDEYFDETRDSWRPLNQRFFGLKYGFNPIKQDEIQEWKPVRRTVPTGFRAPTVD